MKRVSVVVPTWNQEKYVEATLDHLMFQDYRNLEIVVVDDASTDGTPRILKEYEKRVRTDMASYASRALDDGTVERVQHLRYPQNRALRIHLFDENVGATRNYNRGFERITGEYCTFVVGDDIPHPQMISTLAAALDADADFAYSDMFIVDDAGRILRKFELPDYSFERCFADWYLCGVSKLFRSDLMRGHRFDASVQVANDYDLFARFAMAGSKFVRIPRVLYSVRHHGTERKQGQHAPSNEHLMIVESLETSRKCHRFLEAERDGVQVPQPLTQCPMIKEREASRP